MNTSLEFSLAECTLMANIINICSQRGAFKPDEFKIVGDLYTKVAEHVKANAPKPEEPEESKE